jgi:hypothetical protein
MNPNRLAHIALFLPTAAAGVFALRNVSEFFSEPPDALPFLANP